MTISFSSIYKQLLSNGLKQVSRKHFYEVNLINEAKYIQWKLAYNEHFNKKLLFRLHNKIITMSVMENETTMSVDWTIYYEKHIKEYTNSDEISANNEIFSIPR